ncbi:Rpn family recombination-promoting nuclease/putative transposase [Limosilactobacillus albertensis]|uniref:Rpn family recombination-promoting nuclease/putative transposase n=1 Tax=Limosilactobacillus albertensis TaxID=2759752 RepID=A0A839H4Y2_9LACO|nr:Rpn family recombination-promoting nuclease/putative transposase [Limosilactobacillus albertensis]MBB1123640.1 Rpn family recombination-promoting nuclease/putative transposase [Limosilactobacillus albertensis]MCD7123125.1 Rpn family recombination-promoting nuclease/putative transposase [Limosilactobacillus albertensis]
MNNELRKKWDNADLTDDYIFNKVMLDKEICLELLRRILPDLNIKDIQYPNNQQEFSLAPDAKAVRFDIYTTDERNNHYDIEMQVVNEHNLAKRIRYYQAASTMEAYDKGKTYDFADNSYVIFFCNFDPFNLGFQCYTLHKHIDNAPEHIIRDGQTDILFNIPSSNHDVTPKMQAVLDLIAQRNIEEPDAFVVKLRERMRKVKQNRKWRAEYMRLSMYEMDQQIRERKIQELQTKVEEAQSKLKEGQAKLEEGKSRLAENRAKLNEDKSKLAEDQTKLNESKSKLAEDQAKLQNEQDKLKSKWHEINNIQEKDIKALIVKLQKMGINEAAIKECVKTSYKLDSKQLQNYFSD